MSFNGAKNSGGSRLNAVVHLAEKIAIKATEAAHKAITRGEVDWVKQPLKGLPITIKYCLDVVGMPAACGVPMFKERMPDINATVVKRLINADTIVLGKTNTPALAMHWETANPLNGKTNNPCSKCSTRFSQTRFVGGRK